MNQIASSPPLMSVGLEMERWIEGWANRLVPEDWSTMLDPLTQDLIRQAVSEVGGSEGSLWIVDHSQAALVPVFNTGPHAGEFVLKFAQPLNRGIIAMVHANQMSVIESDVAECSQQDPALDRRLGVRTLSLLAVPLQFAGASVGVLSSVILDEVGRVSPGFAAEAIRQFERTAETLRRILEWRLMRLGMGLADR